MTRCQNCGAIWDGPHTCGPTYEDLERHIREMDQAFVELSERVLSLEANSVVGQANHALAELGAELLHHIKEENGALDYLRDMASPTYGMDLTDQEITFVRAIVEVRRTDGKVD